MVSSSTFLQSIVKLVRDQLDSNITDPISAKRNSNEKFVLTAYPMRGVKYPVITVKEEGIPEARPLGLRSELHWIEVPVEIRVWARNNTERSSLSDSVIDFLRGAEFDTFV